MTGITKSAKSHPAGRNVVTGKNLTYVFLGSKHIIGSLGKLKDVLYKKLFFCCCSPESFIQEIFTINYFMTVASVRL